MKVKQYRAVIQNIISTRVSWSYSEKMASILAVQHCACLDEDVSLQEYIELKRFSENLIVGGDTQ